AGIEIGFENASPSVRATHRRAKKHAGKGVIVNVTRDSGDFIAPFFARDGGSDDASFHGPSLIYGCFATCRCRGRMIDFSAGSASKRNFKSFTQRAHRAQKAIEPPAPQAGGLRGGGHTKHFGGWLRGPRLGQRMSFMSRAKQWRVLVEDYKD